MNKELRWKLAEMILDKSRDITRLVRDGEFHQIDSAIQKYFEELGFERVSEGRAVEDSVPWQATPPGEGPHLLFKQGENHLYFAATVPPLVRHSMILKIDKEAAEKILTLGLP